MAVQSTSHRGCNEGACACSGDRPVSRGSSTCELTQTVVRGRSLRPLSTGITTASIVEPAPSAPCAQHTRVLSSPFLMISFSVMPAMIGGVGHFFTPILIGAPDGTCNQ